MASRPVSSLSSRTSTHPLHQPVSAAGARSLRLGRSESPLPFSMTVYWHSSLLRLPLLNSRAPRPPDLQHHVMLKASPLASTLFCSLPQRSLAASYLPCLPHPRPAPVFTAFPPRPTPNPRRSSPLSSRSSRPEPPSRPSTSVTGISADLFFQTQTLDAHANSSASVCPRSRQAMAFFDVLRTRSSQGFSVCPYYLHLPFSSHRFLISVSLELLTMSISGGW